ncbi:hypothetical protein ACGE0T_14425 [Parabacteroides sp. APC149_11_2_Y6]
MISEEEQNKIILISKLTDKEKFCLDAYLVNGDRKSAYVYSRDRMITANSDSVSALIRKFFAQPKVKAYIEARRNQIEAKRDKERFEEEGVDYTQIDKAELLQQLVLLFRTEKDTKIKADLGMKIADLQQMKKEQTEQEEQIKYYLPLQCSKCELYLNAKMSDNNT